MVTYIFIYSPWGKLLNELSALNFKNTPTVSSKKHSFTLDPFEGPSLARKAEEKARKNMNNVKAKE